MADNMDKAVAIGAGIGAANWGAVSFLDFNIVDKIAAFAPQYPIANIVYGAVAIAGVVLLFKTLGK